MGRRARAWSATLLATATLGLAIDGSAAPVRSPGVQARFDLDPGGPSPFPADWLTVADRLQRTGLRIALPLPRCAVERSACDEIRLLQELDGFDLEPRLAVRFTGPIDLGSVTPRSLFLIRLVAGPAEVTGVDRLVWDPATHTLYGRPESLLEPETRYGLVVTRELRDAEGRRVEASPQFHAFLRHPGGPPGARPYRVALGQLARVLERRGVRPDAIAAAAVFTTGSVTAFLEQARDALERRPPPPALMTAPEEGGRAWFPRRGLARLVLRRQVAASPGPPGAGAGEPAPAGFQDEPLPLGALALDAVAGVGIGWYWSPSYLTRERRIAEGPSLVPVAGPATDSPVPFVVVLPAGRPPAGGWPLAIFGHGYGGEMLSSSLLVAGTLARHGIATIAVSVVGHGGGPESRLLVTAADGRSLTVRVPGRGMDLDRDGRIGRTEGLAPLADGPLAALGPRDGLRQQVVDLLALVRAVRRGLDVDGDGLPDTGQGPLFYVGHSLGGIYGALLLAVEPGLRAGVLNVPGGPIVDVARLSPVFRPLVRDALAQRSPPLLNLPGDFREDLPGAGGAAITAPAPGALAIQEYLARALWLGRRGDPVAYAPHLRRTPLPGVEPARVLVQFAVGDGVVANATTAALVRAGDLGDRTVAFLPACADAAGHAAPEPHGFLLALGAARPWAEIARAAQEQAARFLDDDGETVPPVNGAWARGPAASVAAAGSGGDGSPPGGC
jgi:hypothetical protein